MCMQLYIGLDNELPIKGEEFFPWELRIENADDNFANENLTKKYKYGLMGCACDMRFDFNVKNFDEAFNIDLNKRGKQSIEALFEYIRTNAKSDNCELLSFWADNHKMEHNDVIDLKSFVLGDSFKFLEGQYIVVYK